MDQLESDFLNAYTDTSNHPILYHYTSLSGLLGIVNSGTIWATNSQYLNDVAESREIWTFLKSRLDQFRRERRTFSLLDLDKLEEMLSRQKALESYVASFSEDDDSLGQ